MTNYLIYFATIALVLPAYFMGLFFVFKYFTIELKDLEKKKGLYKEKKDYDNDKNFFIELSNKLDSITKSLKRQKEEKEIPHIEKEPEKEIEPEEIKEDNDKEDEKEEEEENLLEKEEDEPTEKPKKKEPESESIKLQSFLARMDFVKFRNSLSIENIEAKLNVVLNRIVNNFMQTEYYTNKKYINSDGTYNLPMITRERREHELILLYARFRKLVSEDIMEELSMVYSREELDSETFIISNYIAPIYNGKINELKKRYRKYEEEMADIERAGREERMKFEKKYDNPQMKDAYETREKLMSNPVFVGMLNNNRELTEEEKRKEKMREYYLRLAKDNDRFRR